MGVVIPFFEDNAFDPQTTSAMGQAFELACQSLRIGGQPEIVKEVMAKRIIQAAQNGERDPHRLAVKAMDAVGLHLP
jgi:hypothetical protein